MDTLQRVLWREGLFLTPHHLQQWDRYLEHREHRSLRATQQFGWGLTEIGLNEEALREGQVEVLRCSGLLPDGLFFSVPDLDVAPASRPVLDAFPPDVNTRALYIGVPHTPAGGISASDDGTADGRPTRYRSQRVHVRDETTGGNEREIEVATCNLRVLFEGESLDGYSALQIAELTRDAAGAIVISETFVPPCLSLEASPSMLGCVRRILEVLGTRSDDLASQRRQRASGLLEFTLSEAANFWFLHTINETIPPLLHIYQNPATHPEQVYLELSRLAGKLCTFSGEGHPKDVPPYDHHNLTETFGQLEALLRGLLETIIPTRCVPISLERLRDSVYAGRITDERLLENAELYLAVAANVPVEKVVTEIPIKAKITSQDRLDRLISQAVRGVDVKFLPAPPVEIPIQPGRSYFRLDRRGEHWDAVKAAKTIAFYVPPEFTNLKLELMAVRDSV